MKACIICYGLREHNIRLQPWRYISEIASGLFERGIEVKIITDGPAEKRSVNGVSILNVNKLRKLPFQLNEELISLIRFEQPDIILWSVTALDYLYLNTFKQIDIPVIGMFTGPIYDLTDIKAIGTYEVLRNIRLLSGHILYASLPSFFMREVVNSPCCSKIFVMSLKNKKIIVENGGDKNKVVHIPVGIDESDFIVYDEYKSIIGRYNLDKNAFNILYFGSPLAIRGIDSLIKAVSKIKSKHPQIKLLILSRRNNDELNHEENDIKKLVLKLRLEENVQLISGFLDKDEVKKFIRFSDIIALPFKIVPSDMPTSILETMAMGKVVISTSVDGIPEVLENNRGLIVKPNKEEDIAEKIVFSIQNRDLIKNMGEEAVLYMQTYPRWNDVVESVILKILEVFENRSNDEASS